MLEEFCLLYGACVQQDLVLAVKDPSKTSLKVTTHLVRATGGPGIKYDHAKEYNIPVVNFKWVMAAGIFDEQQPEEDFAL